MVISSPPLSMHERFILIYQRREEAKKLYRKKRANGTNKEIKSNR